MSRHLIDTQKTLDDACRTFARVSAIGLDTEFLRVRTYYPRLALVQISTRDAIYCIDPLAEGVRLEGLWSVVTDSGICKVIHSARQDIEVLLHTAGVMPGPLFDTQIAAALLGSSEQVGYAALVEAEFGESLPKGEQRTDWTRRPLSEDQLGYAANDVRYLLPLHERLTARLASLGRLEWALEDVERLRERDLYEPDPEQAWRRVGRGAHLKPRAQHQLKRLCAWRERMARRRDLPRHWVLDDEAVAAIAAAEPGSVAELEGVTAVGESVVRRDGWSIIECLESPVDNDAPLWARVAPLSPEQKALRAALTKVLKARAAELQIPSSVLATRSDIEKLVRGAPVAEIIEGWRWTEIGRDFDTLLADSPGSERTGSGAEG